jgi:DNA-binding transcriptional regulator YiaG
MPDIAQVLRAEIQRIARKELRIQLAGLNKQIKDLKDTVRQQRERITELERATPRQARAPKPEPVEDTPSSRPRRIRPATIRQQRERLRLSQRQLGELLGVTAITVGRWESGQSAPRDQYRQQMRISEQSGHPFRSKVATHFGAKWPRFRSESGHYVTAAESGGRPVPK